MGEVYEAEDLDLRVSVALKTVRPEIADHDIALERFRREIQLARKVTHPNVCRIFDVGHHQAKVPETGEEREIVFLTMEHLEGETLAHHLRESGPMDEALALPIVQQMCNAIDAAHEAGIVHRDFKSSNVLLVPDSARPGGMRAVVTDFGLARGSQPEDTLSTSLSSSGQTVGTPTYMAPEQVAGSTVTPSVDIYALGIVVFEMVTGRPPFVSDSPLSTAVKRLIEAPPAPRSLNPSLGSRWESGILRCLEKDPTSRFRKASDLVRWIEGKPLSDSGAARLPLGRLSAVMSIVILIISAVVAFGWWRDQNESPRTLSAQTRPLAAVIGFRNLTGNPDAAWLATALQEMLSMELAASETIRVVSGDTVARARRELGLGSSSSLSTDEIDRISRNLGADLVILGSYFIEEGADDPQIRLDVRVHRRGAEEVVSPVIETGARSDLLKVVSRAGETLRSELGYGAGVPDTATALMASYPADPGATMAYARGLQALRNGDSMKARTSLESAVRIEPDNPLAHSALASVWSSLGYQARARDAAKRAMELSSALPREERLLIKARYYGSESEWDEAARIYAELWSAAPDNIEYGLALARAQANAGESVAFDTINRLHALSDANDPRVSLAEASAAEALGEFARERDAAIRAAELSRDKGSWVLLARAKLSEWWAERNMGDLEAATAASSEALRIANQVGERSLVAQALNAIATTKRQMGHTEEARKLDLQSLEVFREVGDKRREGWALNNLGRSYYEQGQFEEAMKYFRSSLLLVREIDDVAGVTRALGNQGNVLHDLGRFRESETLFREMFELASSGNDARSIPWARVNLAGTLVATGRLDEAKELLKKAAEGFAATGERRGQGWTLIREGEISLYSDEPSVAEEKFRKAVATFSDIGDQRAKYRGQVKLAEALLATGRESEVRSLLGEVLTLQKSMGDQYGEALTNVIAARAALARGNPSAAAELAAGAAGTALSLRMPHLRSEALLHLSRAQLAAGKTAAALATLENGRRLDEHDGDERLKLLFKIAAAEIAAASGDVNKAVEGLEDAQKSSRAFGYLDLASRAESILSTLAQ